GPSLQRVDITRRHHRQTVIQLVDRFGRSSLNRNLGRCLRNDETRRGRAEDVLLISIAAPSASPAASASREWRVDLIELPRSREIGTPLGRYTRRDDERQRNQPQQDSLLHVVLPLSKD